MTHDTNKPIKNKAHEKGKYMTAFQSKIVMPPIPSIIIKITVNIS